jgi:diguanylate cyclase (GGDEF)-like protein/PAS domain S-box-containing protein
MRLDYINPAVTSITGYTPVECYADPYLMLNMAHPEDSWVMADHLQSRKMPDEPLFMRWIGKDGLTRWMESRIVPIYGAEGQVIAVEGITRDITARKKAEQALIESEARLRLLGENLEGVGLYVYSRDVNGKPHFEYLSPGAEALTGIKAEYALRDAAIVHSRMLPENIPAFLQYTKKSQEDLSRLEMEVRQQNAASGEIHWVLMRATPRRREDGSTVWYGAQVDITERKRVETELRENRKFLADLIEYSATIVFVKDKEGRYELVNHRYEEITGVPREVIIGHTDMEIFSEEHSAQYRASDLQVLESGQALEMEDFIDKPEGRQHLFTIKFPLRADDGSFRGVCGITTDITLRKQAEQQLRKSEERYRIVTDNTHDWAFWQAPDGRFIYSSPSCKHVTGHEADEFLQDANLFLNIIHPDDRGVFLTHYETVREKHIADIIEFRIRLSDGSERWIDHACQPIFDDAGSYLGVRDSTLRKRAEIELANANAQLHINMDEVLKLQAELREQALHDPMTGLYNRRYMDDVFAREFARAKRENYIVSVIMLDMDRLKILNDTYGHDIGDKGIQTLAACLQKLIRAEDVVCRLGGDEFVIMMGRTDVKDAVGRTEEWREFLDDHPMVVGGASVQVKFTAGIAGFPAHGDSVEEVIKRADTALYRAKDRGRNCTMIFE